MIEVKQTATFIKWEKKLKDKRAKAAIAARIFRLANGLVGDVSAVGQGVSELRIHYGPGYRVYFNQKGNDIVILLCGGDKSSQSRDIEMKEQLYNYDPASALNSPEAVEVFMADAFETGDATYIAKALGVVARAQGMSQVARKTGLSREQLYRSFSERGNPTLKTTLAVLQALGLDITSKLHV